MAETFQEFQQRIIHEARRARREEYDRALHCRWLNCGFAFLCGALFGFLVAACLSWERYLR